MTGKRASSCTVGLESMRSEDDLARHTMLLGDLPKGERPSDDGGESFDAG